MIWQKYLSRNSPITRKTSWSLRKRVKEEKAILAKMLQFLSKGPCPFHVVDGFCLRMLKAA